ncbi:hypothetical protein [Nostoc sp.]|uniref:hypothetical protein n=1 Tax=Nostoc sp. TaxID=1180 RepID=UPI002FFAF57A
MNQCLDKRTYYSISFWDVGYTYEVGQTPADDWIGVRRHVLLRRSKLRGASCREVACQQTSQSEFNYNP